ncbi:MAG: metal-dependent hydrolase [Bacillota bacterium]
MTHGLLGLAIGMARPRDGGPENPLNPTPTDTDRAVVLGALVAAELPDLDVFSGLLFGGGPLAEYVYHRGLTHALLFSPVIAVVAALLVWPFFRRARLLTVTAWALLSAIAHMLNDWFTGWGTRLLLPFSDARLGLDWVPIIDLLYTLPLLLAVIMAARRPLQRRRWALGALAYLVIYSVGYRGLSHTLVQQAVREAYQGQPVVKMRVSPSLFNPLAWSFTVDLGDRYEVGQTTVFGPVKPGRTLVKQPEDTVIRAVREMEELKPFFDQFKYPLITYEVVPDGYRVSLGDVRYQMRGAGMQYLVHISTDLKLTAFLSGGH